jgi:hypothetical protein
MKNIFKYSLALLTVVLGFASCDSEKDANYEPAAASGSQVYFSNETPATVNITKDATSFSIPVLRVNTAGDLSVAITATDESGLFTIPSSVSFKDGESEAALTIGYDPTKLEYDDYKTIAISINDEQLKTLYGMSAITFNVGIKSPWVSLGKGAITDDIVASIFSVPNYTWAVEIEENAIQPGFYRVLNPYTADYPLLAEDEDGEFTVSKDPHYLYIHAEDPEAVYIELFATGLSLNADYGEISFQSLGNYFLTQQGKTLEEIKAAGYVGTLKEGVITFPVEGLLWGMALYKTGEAVNFANSSGLFSIVLPGYSMKDYSVGVEFNGIYTNLAGEAYAVANVELGADVTNAKAVVMTADVDESAVADALASGELEGVSVNAGANNIRIAEDMIGSLKIIVAVIDEGEVKDYASTKFEYYGGASNPWKSVGTGYYTEDYIISYYGQKDDDGNFIPYDPETYEVEIEENSDTPGLYRMKNAYAKLAAMFNETGGDKDIVVHAEIPTGVYILMQGTGVDFGKGEFGIESYGGYLISQNSDAPVADVVNYFTGKFGTLENGTITFPTITSKDETQFQGYLYANGQLFYYGGTTLASKIVLPTASASVKAKAKKRAAATDFARRLHNMSNANKVAKSSRVLLISKKVKAVKR